MKKQRCPQCYQKRAYPREFIGARGRPVKMCTTCQSHYRNWTKKTPAERAAVPRKGVPVVAGDVRVTFVESSKNEKLGGIPATMSSRSTCPPTCSFYDAGCYAIYGKIAHHWRNVDKNGVPWSALCALVASLPEGQLWRHNVSGDLPGDGVAIDTDMLRELVVANRGRRGFTFTHYGYDHGPDIDTVLHNNAAVAWANRNGFTVNLSADSLEQADRLVALRDFDGAPVPVVVVVPHDAPKGLKTPAGRTVVICPAETDHLTCDRCRLCALPNRKSIIGFRAHGQSKALVSDLVQLRRKESAA